MNTTTNIMNALRLILLSSLLIFSADAQTTNTPLAPNVRLQSEVERRVVGTTNVSTQVGTNLVKPSAHLDEFIGTLLAVDNEKQTVSIALGPPFLVKQVKSKLLYLAPDTKFFKGELAATLNDGVIGEAVRYRIRINHPNDKPLLTILRFLPDFKGNEHK